MDKDLPPTKLTAEYYRRKNHHLSMSNANEGPKLGGSTQGDGGAKSSPHPPPPPPHRPPPPPKSKAHNALSRFGTSAKNFAGKSIRLGGTALGLVAAVNIASYYYECAQVEKFFGTGPDDDKEKETNKKKRVLVLPFDNLKVIEHAKSGQFELQRFTNAPNKQPTITIEAKELVDIIHKAASDPNVTALYADFGEGMRYPMGYAHMEEIRNAVRIFNESHRVHRDPNVNHNPVFAMMRNGDPKPSYAFGYGFQWGEYFLASAFSYVHLQARGNLHLFGVSMNNLFLGGMLEKYGIKAHVFRHGVYKNAPSIFTDKKYSKPHLENVQSLTSSLNNTIRTGIENSRALNFDTVMWQSIFDYGSLTSANSAEIGLVDSTPPVDPLLPLLEINQAEEKSETMLKNAKMSGLELQTQDGKKVDEDHKPMTKVKKKFNERFDMHESFKKFTATEPVSLIKYKQMVDKRKKIEQMQKQIDVTLGKLAQTSTATSMLLSAFGMQPDSALLQRDKVAVLTVAGSIGGSLSYEVIQSLRQIKKDNNVKSVVLRVDSPGGSVVSSEAILEEIKLLDKPVVCSMSNAAASGGYYVAMNSEKIFASPSTITGSIGVFGMKFDASKWAKSYEIRADYFPRGSHAAAMHPLTPLTKGTKDNISRMVLDYYDYFKGIVSTGRSLSLDEVEKVAQGRVWTGEQAKEVGLVDALGGLDRAISYAKKAHTKTDQVDVEHWPKRSFRLEDVPKLLSGAQESASYEELVQGLLSATTMGLDDAVEHRSTEQLLSELTELKFAEKPHFMMTVDEKTAIDLIMRGE